MAVSASICDFGWKAKDFKLKAVDGRTLSLADVRGPKGVVVVFICNHCPYVKAVIDRLVRDARELAGHGIGAVAISSNDARQYPEDSFDQMREFAEQHAFSFPYLYDETQDVARSYDAICTPDFFGFNASLELQYRGRLDAGRTGQVTDARRRDLFEAMKLVAATGRGPTDQLASMGCSIKWKPQ